MFSPITISTSSKISSSDLKKFSLQLRRFLVLPACQPSTRLVCWACPAPVDILKRPDQFQTGKAGRLLAEVRHSVVHLNQNKILAWLRQMQELLWNRATVEHCEAFGTVRRFCCCAWRRLDSDNPQPKMRNLKIKIKEKKIIKN